VHTLCDRFRCAVFEIVCHSLTLLRVIGNALRPFDALGAPSQVEDRELIERAHRRIE
jgi:hypothetical protein